MAAVVFVVVIFSELLLEIVVKIVSVPEAFSELSFPSTDFSELLVRAPEIFVFTGCAPQLGKIRQRTRHKHTGHKITVRFIKVLLSQQ